MSENNTATANRRPQTFVMISQVYAPDPAAVGQYMADAARELAARGHRVIVYTSRNGYDDPSITYPASEVRDGVHVRRLPFSSFGKSSIAVRLVAGFIFLSQAVLRTLFIPRFDALLITTSPPTAPLAGIVIHALRRCRLYYWVMDINPDQLVAQKRAVPDALPVRLFNAMQRAVMRRATRAITLDRFMACSMARKLDIGERLRVLPLWPLTDQCVDPVPDAGSAFRAERGLQDRTVVMYSGNHTRSNPLDTLVTVAQKMEHGSDLSFVFVGGGELKPEIDAIDSPAFHSAPYQPIESLAESLSAADVHVISIGDDMVGIVHPCKIYGAMAVGRPVLIMSPPESHLTDILALENIGWHVAHGDADGMKKTLETIANLSREELQARGAKARELIDTNLSRAHLCGYFCDMLETSSMPQS